MIKWEYFQVFLTNKMMNKYTEVDFLNLHGEQGWELCLKEGYYYTFKRIKSE